MAAPPPLTYADGAGASLDLPLLALYSSHAGNAQNSDLYASCGWTAKMTAAAKAISSDVFFDTLATTVRGIKELVEKLKENSTALKEYIRTKGIVNSYLLARMVAVAGFPANYLIMPSMVASSDGGDKTGKTTDRSQQASASAQAESEKALTVHLPDSFWKMTNGKIHAELQRNDLYRRQQDSMPHSERELAIMTNVALQIVVDMQKDMTISADVKKGATAFQQVVMSIQDSFVVFERSLQSVEAREFFKKHKINGTFNFGPWITCFDKWIRQSLPDIFGTIKFAAKYEDFERTPTRFLAELHTFRALHSEVTNKAAMLKTLYPFYSQSKRPHPRALNQAAQAALKRQKLVQQTFKLGQQAGQAGQPGKNKSQTVCLNFLKGNCSYGLKCKFKH